MKKFYTLIFTAGLLGYSLVSQAQGTYTSITPNSGPGAPYTLDDGRFWQGGIPPPNPCDNCTITIQSSVSMVPDDGTSSTGAAAGSQPNLSHIVLTNSTLQINGGSNLNIETYVEMSNTKVLIGSDATTAASVFINDQVVVNDASGTSSVQLANENCFIDANNNFGHPIDGPETDYTGTVSAGIYYITAIDPHGFTQTLNSIGNGSSLPGGGFPQYNYNCDPAVPGSPNTCGTGTIFGPAITSVDPTSGLIFGQGVTLPVQLVQFVATKNADASVKLSWSTTQEVNSSSFEVERSADQGNWQKIGSVQAKGYSSITLSYSYTDQFPIAGNGYYRLKMIDLDGKFQYSKVVSVSSDRNSLPLVVYSNPFTDQIRVKVNVSRAENLSLIVSDITGKTYLKQSYNAQAGDNLINLVPAGAASGMYILHIEGNTYNQTVKLAKQ